jgi:hypothetical protein
MRFTSAIVDCSKRRTTRSWSVRTPRIESLATKNVDDFVKLARARELHPGIILLEDGDLVREEQLRVLRSAVAALQGERDLVNRVLRVWADGRVIFEDVPKS